ncbi:MAG: exoribonuclease II [Congregibacter sp.]
MLDRSALSQLKGLKNQMEAEKERTEGVVRGTPARYGFVRLDDGREVFIPPDEMLKAFPGDRVRVCVKPGKDKRPQAEIEGLVETPVSVFTGRCVSKGKALFVVPDLPSLSRWLFLPPSARNNAKAGDFLRCELLRHPVRDGKPQAKVLELLGNEHDPGIENTVTMARHGLTAEWSSDDLALLKNTLSGANPLEDDRREDLTDLSFVSIDAARTQDIDDALYAEVTNDGWILYVAIADPTAFIPADSPLRETVAARASSVYFHGAVVPMLPEELAHEHCALAEDALRPALVCRVAISEAGEVGDFRFLEAKVRSRAKLSYYAVDRYLTGDDQSLVCHQTPLEALFQASRALRARREAQELVMEDRQEYRWMLDDSGHIEAIEPSEKLQSQRLVEECMVAANRCAARLLQEKQAAGPFVVHDGFRRDRLKDREQFMASYVTNAADIDPDSLEGYRDLIKQLTDSDHELPLRSMVNRLLTRARLSKRPGAHKGMCLPVYTNCTSPLRRYLDFLVHVQIKALLRDEDANSLEQNALDALNQRLLRLRQVSQEAERWLALEYLQRLAKDDKGPWAGTVSHITNTGFSVRLDANGLEGYVDLRKLKERFSFDKATATLASKTRHFRVAMPVQVTFAGHDDEDKPHLALFSVTAQSGLKVQSGLKAESGSAEQSKLKDQSEPVSKAPGGEQTRD